MKYLAWLMTPLCIGGAIYRYEIVECILYTGF
ncbi:hypothetical protein TELCIR_19928 [Teladorsagia circumcincta]|uniref:Uncharacterized protein n=1 Tax=Teladorsagia circumcincta TaxID=45464 RepID=A0A2G9TMC7_TELCI|nr:hypothetical protein TELCIR_19928 [Teladorsagia circumcincta]